MTPPRIGFTCSSFDLLHAGHTLMLEEAKAQSNLAKQANNLMKHELDRAVAVAKYGEELKIREIED